MQLDLGLKNKSGRRRGLKRVMRECDSATRVRGTLAVLDGLPAKVLAIELEA
jgi:hypothetical protein